MLLCSSNAINIVLTQLYKVLQHSSNIKDLVVI